MGLVLWSLLLCVVLAYWFLKPRKKKVNLPGPKGIPIFGNLFQLGTREYITFTEWAQQYGDVYAVDLMGDPYISISDPKIGREMFALDQFAGRPTFDVFLLYEGERWGIINTHGELWETHRRFTLRQLRDFGFGKNSMETLIMDEVNELLERLKNKKGAPVGGIKELFVLAVVNALWTVVTSKRFTQDDPHLRAISNSLNRALMESANSGGLIFFFPWLRHIIPGYTGYTSTRYAFESVKVIVVDAVKEHLKTFQADTCRDFIDVYLKEMHNSDSKSSFHGEAGEKQLAAIVGDLFFAGTDTTSTTLAWAILYLATHQKVQKKLQDEISSISGNSRAVSVADRPNMPYTQGTIEEVLRMSSIVPTGVEHEVLEDVEFRGVTYAKGAMVGLNAYFVHHNPKIWRDPESFRPERFLGDDGKTFKKNENVIAFSVGKRQCLGETLARDSVFLFMTNIFQTFHVTCDPKNPNPTLEPGIGFAMYPQEYSVLFKMRDEE